MTAAVLAAAAVVLAGCQPARMALPPDLQAGAAEWEVTGKKTFSFDESFAFGPYRVEEVKRGWTRRSRLSVGSYQTVRAGQRYEFTLRREGEEEGLAVQVSVGAIWSQVELQEFLGSRSTLDWDVKSRETIAASIVPAGGGEDGSWRLAGEQRERDWTLNGVLTDGETEIAIRGTQDLEGTPMPLAEASGYLFLAGNRPVGAVEVINRGRVWIAGDQPEEKRDAMAASSAALLLYRALRK